MKNSNFQFTNPQLVRLQFVQNEQFSANKDVNVNIQCSVDIQRLPSVSTAPHEEARVAVFVRIGDTEDASPFCLEVEEAANFRWATGAYTGDDIDVFLNQNAVALLISYLRPIIANVTAASRFGAFHLPFLDLTNTSSN